MPNYSKAPRGLSVLLQVVGIFTDITTSPGLQPRQLPNHFTIRAGRNLPDKEFRYLRTVIVTAAVHWGFNSNLSILLLTFQHWAGVSPYTSPFSLAQTCVFDKQLLGTLHCDLHQLQMFSFTYYRHPFSRSYGAILQSSLARVILSASGFSPSPPVSVYSTGTPFQFRSFSRQCRICNLCTLVHFPIRPNI